jgi:hypothetical protein
MAAFRDLILGARIGSETKRDPMRKMMIALATAFSVCTATKTSGTPAAFARGSGSFGGALMALVEAASEVTDMRWAAVTAGILEASLAILAAAFGTGFGRFGFGLYGYAGGFYSDYGYGACLVPPPNGYAWACY